MSSAEVSSDGESSFDAAARKKRRLVVAGIAVICIVNLCVAVHSRGKEICQRRPIMITGNHLTREEEEERFNRFIPPTEWTWDEWRWALWPTTESKGTNRHGLRPSSRRKECNAEMPSRAEETQRENVVLCVSSATSAPPR